MSGYQKRAGMTLVELIVVILIISILASLAIPQYFRALEKTRAGEVAAYVGSVRRAQDRFSIKFTVYCNDANSLDIPPLQTKYFNNAFVLVNGAVATTGWQATFTRMASPMPPAPYTAGYTVIYNSLTGNFTSSDANVTRDLLPQ